MKARLIGLVILLLMSFVANAEAIYSCIKEGKKTISDRPCQSYGAEEKNKIEYTAGFDATKVGLNRGEFYKGGQGAEQGQNGACRNDASRFCGNARGERPITDCLLNHQQEVSDSCYASLKQRLQNQQGIQACKRESEQLCKGSPPGEERTVDCLLDHQKELSDACYDALAKKLKSQ